MKTAFAAVAQFVLFLLVFLAFSLLDPFHLKWFITHPTQISTRYFVPDGLLIAFILYALILLLEAVTKKLRTAGLWTSVAFVLALVLGLASKFGFVTTSLY